MYKGGWTETSGADTSLIECQTQATYPKIYHFFPVVLKINLNDTPSLYLRQYKLYVVYSRFSVRRLYGL